MARGPVPLSLIPGLAIATRVAKAAVETGGAPLSVTNEGIRVREIVDVPAPRTEPVQTPRPVISGGGRGTTTADLVPIVDLIRPDTPVADPGSNHPGVRAGANGGNGGNGGGVVEVDTGCATCGGVRRLPAGGSSAAAAGGQTVQQASGAITQQAGFLSGSLPLLLILLLVGGLIALVIGRPVGNPGNPAPGRRPKAVRCSKCGFFRSSLPGSSCKGCARKGG